MKTLLVIPLALFLATALLGGCASRSTGASGSATSSQGPTVSLSDAELQYGVAPTRNSEVVYQPDVIIPQGGASAVRSVSSNGLTWTIDASAPGAADLMPGKIMFLTGRGVGRVLHVAHNGNDLGITLGPVQLTDVIQQAHLSGNQTVDAGAMRSYSAPDWPGAETSLAAAPVPSLPRVADIQPVFASFNESRPARLPLQLAQASLLPPGIGPPPEVITPSFSFNPFTDGGLSMNFNSPVKNAALAPVQVHGSVALHMLNPYVSYDINITTRGIETAKFEVHNTAGLTLNFEASSNADFAPKDNLKKLVFLPIDLSVPLGGPVPLAFTLHQTFMLETLFTAKNSKFTAGGDYALAGSLKMECHYSTCSASGPGSFIVRKSLMDSISGISLGINALIITYEVRAIVGIGAFGFVTGPFVGLGLTAGVTRGSDAGSVIVGVTCRQVDMQAWVKAGVGYRMPPSVAKVINFILSVFNVAPIESSGGSGVTSPLFDPKHQRIGCGSDSTSG